MGKRNPKVSFKARIGVLKHLPGMHFVEIPASVVKKLGGKFNLRVVCSINQKLSFQGGLVALGGGRAYISITKKRLKELGLSRGDVAHITLALDESEFGMEMPEELTEVLSQDDQGRSRFERLTPGRQRYVIFYVKAVKSPDLRIERALLLIENLKRLPEGKESFRKMLGKLD